MRNSISISSKTFIYYTIFTGLPYLELVMKEEIDSYFNNGKLVHCKIWGDYHLCIYIPRWDEYEIIESEDEEGGMRSLTTFWAGWPTQ